MKGGERKGREVEKGREYRGCAHNKKTKMKKKMSRSKRPRLSEHRDAQVLYCAHRMPYRGTASTTLPSNIEIIIKAGSLTWARHSLDTISGTELGGCVNMRPPSSTSTASPCENSHAASTMHRLLSCWRGRVGGGTRLNEKKSSQEFKGGGRGVKGEMEEKLIIDIESRLRKCLLELTRWHERSSKNWARSMRYCSYTSTPCTHVRRGRRYSTKTLKRSINLLLYEYIIYVQLH